MSAIRRLSRIVISACLSAALGFLFIGTAPAQAASDADSGVTTHRGGVYGRIVKVTRAKGDPNLKSTATPVGNSSATPTDGTPGRVSMYNAGTGQYRGLVRVWTKKEGAKRYTAQTWDARVDLGDPLHFNLTYWEAVYVYELYADDNGNGVIDSGDTRLRYQKVKTSRRWARRHEGATRQYDVVVSGSGDGGGNNPPPVSQYPKGAVISVNGRQSSMLTRIDYTVSTTTLSYAYPNITFGNWAYEAFTGWYGATAAQVSEKVTWSDATTQTKVVSAPTSATAEPTVTTFTGSN